MEEDERFFYNVLKEADLEIFFNKFKINLQITKLSHLEFVKSQDLQSIGLSKPAIRRLMNTLNKIKKKNTDFQKNSNLTENYKFLINELDITFLSDLGSGSYGTVRKALWRVMDFREILVAVKQLKKCEGWTKEFLNEVKAMYHLNSPHLVQLHGVVLSQPPMMVTELASVGCLSEHLIASEGKLSLFSLFNFSVQLLLGMVYLENKHLLHRDLASRNLFLFSDEKVKIGDFGLMRILGKNKNIKENIKIPFAWSALESLISQLFSHQSDVWMVAVCLWEIFSFGKEPWLGLTPSQVVEEMEKGKRLKCPIAMPLELYELLMDCWKFEPELRPNFQQMCTFIEKQKPKEVQSLKSFHLHQQSNIMKVHKFDWIFIIENKPDSKWCFGQNGRTFEIAKFPKFIISDQKITARDISLPLRGSFLHVGSPVQRFGSGLSRTHSEKLVIREKNTRKEIILKEKLFEDNIQTEIRKRENVLSLFDGPLESSVADLLPPITFLPTKLETTQKDHSKQKIIKETKTNFNKRKSFQPKIKNHKTDLKTEKIIQNLLKLGLTTRNGWEETLQTHNNDANAALRSLTHQTIGSSV